MQLPSQNHLRILVIDDDRDTIMAMHRLLGGDGHVVDHVRKGSDILSLARKGAFDLVLCDIGLPEQDGHSLVAELRAAYPIKSIAITGHGMPREILNLYRGAFDRCFIKPIDFDELRKAVQTIGVLLQKEREIRRQKEILPDLHWKNISAGSPDAAQDRARKWGKSQND